MLGKLYGFAISLFLVACISNDSNGPAEFKSDSCVLNEVVPYREYFKVKSRKEDYLLNLARLFKMPNANRSADLRIRIWLWDGIEKYVIEIERNRGLNKAEVLRFIDVSDLGN